MKDMNLDMLTSEALFKELDSIIEANNSIVIAATETCCDTGLL